MNGLDQVEVPCDFGLWHQSECVTEKRAEYHVGGRFDLVVTAVLCALGNTQGDIEHFLGNSSAWFVSDLTSCRAWTTKKCSMVRSALEYSSHQKTFKTDQIHVAGLDILSVRCGTPDKVCRETRASVVYLSLGPCPRRLMWVKD